MTTTVTTPATAGIAEHPADSLQSFMETAEMSPRLRNVLREFAARFGNLPLDEITPANIEKIRNAGPATSAEFIERRRQYLLDNRQA